MSYPKPPISWVHVWLKPLYDWLVGLLAVVNAGGIPTAIATTDATSTEVVIFTPAKKTANEVIAKITACKADGTLGATWLIAAGFRTDNTPTLSLLGATALSTEADGAWAPTAEIDAGTAGNAGKIVARLVGVAATSINWTITYEVA